MERCVSSTSDHACLDILFAYITYLSYKLYLELYALEFNCQQCTIHTTDYICTKTAYRDCISNAQNPQRIRKNQAGK